MKNHLLVPAALLAVLHAHAGVDARPSVLPLMDESPVTEHQGWGALGKGKSVGGTPLTLDGRVFASGLGMHANGEAEYDLDGAFDSFESKVGVDDAMKGQPKGATVVFQVLVDGVKKFDSGLMRAGDTPKSVRVDVRGAQTLRLVALDGGDGNAADHADWCDTNLTGRNLAQELLQPAYSVKAGDIAVQLDKRGRIVGAKLGAKNIDWPMSGGTTLQGFHMTGEPRVSTASGNTVVITRTLSDEKNHTCTVTDRFSPDKGAVRWEIELLSADAPWSAPIVSTIKCAKPEEKLVWTAWSSPDFSSNIKLAPGLMALVQEGKMSAGGGHWIDPLVPTGFTNRSWRYGCDKPDVLLGAGYTVLPLFTMLDPKADTGLSLVLSPDDPMLDVGLSSSEAGQVRYARSNYRLGGGKSVRFTMHLVAHEADWRGGLRFMTERYPQYFESPNPRAHAIGGCGAYTLCEDKVDPVPLRKMAFGFNWKLSDDFPYMGMFIPPVKSMDEQWERSCGEKETLGQGRMTSCRQMNDYAKYMKDNGFSVLSYFNVTEFGKDMNRWGHRQPKLAADAPDLWKDPAAFVKYRLPTAVYDPGITTCYYAYLTDPADPDYMKFMLEQSARNTVMLPDTDGICIDRADWLRNYNAHADDGVSLINGKPARSLFRSWIELMDKMGPQMHKADKVIFANMMTMRLELCKELDGIYTEFGNNGNALNGSAMLCLRKPAIGWSYNATLHQPNPDAFMQRHLHMGIFPTAPYPRNNHCINPSPEADKLYLEYGPLLTAMRAKKWVLAPHCVETSGAGAKVNLFEVPGGYALPVTFAGDAKEAVVRVRNIPNLAKLRARALHPGVEKPVAVTGIMKDGALELRVPLVRGCAMVQLTD